MTPAIMESLYDLYTDHDVHALVMGTRGVARQCIVTLTLTHPDVAQAHVIRFQAHSQWGDEDDWFDEWSKPSPPMPPESEIWTGITNGQLEHCCASDVVLEQFLDFIGTAEVLQVFTCTGGNPLNLMYNIDI